MRKSSSVQLLSLDFNPKEFKVGQSRIDQLPLRRHSATTLTTLPSTSAPREIEVLRRQNCLLHKQNQQLRKQLQGFKLKSTVKTVCRTEGRVPSYSNAIKDRLNSKVQQSRNTECETRLLSSKEVSLQGSSFAISDYYDQYHQSKKIPTLEDVKVIADRFCKDYQESYYKLKTLFECLQCSKKNQSYLNLQEMVQLYKVPLLYKMAPKSLLREISKSKEKVKMGRADGSRLKKEKEQVHPEQLSPSETALRIEGLLKKVCRSGQMLKILRGNQTVLRFVQKMQQRF